MRIQLFPGGICIEWIFHIAHQAVDEYPDGTSGLATDMAEVTGLLDSYAVSQLSAKELHKAARPFEQKSFKALRVANWEDFQEKLLPATDSRLTEIARLFSEAPTAETRVLILLKVWKLICELAAFKLREPEPHWHSWRDCPEFVATLSDRGKTNA